MRVGECCNRMVVMCDQTTSVREAACLMRKHDMGVLVVVEEAGGNRRPLGLVTERDLVFEVIAKCASPEDARIGDLVPERAMTAHCNDGLWETIERMRALQLRRLTVVDSKGSVQGVLSIDDVLQLLAETQINAMHLLRQERQVDRGYISTIGQPAIGASSDAGVADWRRAA